MSPLTTHEVEVRVEIEVCPGHTPAGGATQVDPQVGTHVVVRRVVLVRGLAAEDSVHLLARVRDEEVGAPVAVIVSACDSHPRVRVGDPGRRRALLEAEPEAGRVGVRSSRPGDVLVQAIGIRVVGDVDVEIAVTLEVREQDPQPVSEVRHLEAGLRADLAERRVLVLPGALVQEQEIANAEVGLREALGCLRARAVQVRVSGHHEIGEAVTVHVPDGGPGVPAVDADPGCSGHPR